MCVLAIASVWSVVVRAQSAVEGEACASGRHVALAFDGGLDPELQREVLADLRSELASRRLTVCLTGDRSAHAALAEVRVEDRGNQRIAIDVFDRATDKRVGRDLELSNVPPNGRALAVAIAIDELLRASWAELALRSERVERPGAATHAPPPAPAPQPEVRVSEPAVRSTLPLGFGAAGTYTRSFDNYDALGAVAVADLLLKRRLWVEGRAGFSSALKRKVAEGSVSVSGPVGALTLGACLPRKTRRLRLCLGLRTALELLTFEGTSDTNAQGQSSLQTIVTSALVAHTRIRVYRALSLAFGAGAGSALFGARVSNGVRTLSRIDGLIIQTSIGLGVER